MSKILRAALHDLAVIVLIVTCLVLALGLVYGLHIVSALAG